MKLFTSSPPKAGDRELAAVASWLKAGMVPVSFNRADEIAVLRPRFPGAHFVSTARTLESVYGRPYIGLSLVLDWAARNAGEPFLLLNADIQLAVTPAWGKEIAARAASGVVVVHRYDFDTDRSFSSEYRTGIDGVAMSPAAAARFPANGLALGQQYWDYWVPWKALELDMPLFRLRGAYAFHQRHPRARNDAMRRAAGTEFYKAAPGLKMTDWGNTQGFIRAVLRRATPFTAGPVVQPVKGLHERRSRLRKLTTRPPLPPVRGRFPLPALLQKHKVRPQGVLHVGASLFEEAPDYEAAWPEAPVIWVDALKPEGGGIGTQTRLGNVFVLATLSNGYGPATFHLTSNRYSSSLLPLSDHREVHPEVTVARKVQVWTERADGVFEPGDLAGIDTLVLDVQGAELKVLEGLGSLIDGFRSIWTEISYRPLYEGSCVVGDLDAWLGKHGFSRVVTVPVREGWYGDALYLRR